jgi:hypothetical protein
MHRTVWEHAVVYFNENTVEKKQTLKRLRERGRTEKIGEQIQTETLKEKDEGIEGRSRKKLPRAGRKIVLKRRHIGKGRKTMERDRLNCSRKFG